MGPLSGAAVLQETQGEMLQLAKLRGVDPRGVKQEGACVCLDLLPADESECNRTQNDRALPFPADLCLNRRVLSTLLEAESVGSKCHTGTAPFPTSGGDIPWSSGVGPS